MNRNLTETKEYPMTDLRQLLAHNMKERRRILKMTQYELAKRAGTSAYYIGMIENRKKYPKPEMMRKIANGLEIDTPELFSMASFPAQTLREYKREILTLIGVAADKVISEKLDQLKGGTRAGKPRLAFEHSKREPLIKREIG